MPGGSFERRVINLWSLTFGFWLLAMVYSLLTKGQRPKTEGPIQKQKPATGCSSGLVEIVLRRLVQLVSAGNRFNGPPPMWW
jgi:hypothetical protein